MLGKNLIPPKFINLDKNNDSKRDNKPSKNIKSASNIKSNAMQETIYKLNYKPRGKR